jgi:hypothetical protein
MSTDKYPRLPDRFCSKVASYPECSYGAVRVTLVLKDGRRIRDVIIGGDAICKIGQTLITLESDLDFSVSDIENVKRATRRTALLNLSVSPLYMVKSLILKHLAVGYLCIGFGISLYQNLFGELTAFVWTGSFKGNLIVLLWWFIVPALIWPWDLLWAFFHRFFNT